MGADQRHIGNSHEIGQISYKAVQVIFVRVIRLTSSVFSASRDWETVINVLMGNSSSKSVQSGFEELFPHENIFNCFPVPRYIDQQRHAVGKFCLI